MATKTKKKLTYKKRANGQEIEVYRSSIRTDNYINAKDCTTEYNKDELIFL